MTETGAVAIREVGPADAEALGRCHLACWAEAYTGMVPQDRLDAAVAAVDERVSRWRAILAEFPGRRLVADHAGEIVGFAAAGHSRDGDLGPDLELYSLYVRQAHWSTGLGHRLLAAAIGEAPASLWVFRDNHRARRFYAQHGFAPDGQEKPEPYFDRPEIRMVRYASVPG
ncbi:GNAT family N-acetyltransferase [uncultured Friedmanniella sp.]|uniref:GNAT family N-acetyltransferase n=1 Tax=uncultured Friedmanniella sp. TaxID=335381 RepID=UPI0035CAB159